jgi:hypothetical protein
LDSSGNGGRIINKMQNSPQPTTKKRNSLPY